MTKKEIEQHIADTVRKAADAIDPKLNQVRKRPQPATTEAAQDKHQAALTSFQTKRKGRIILSANEVQKKRGNK